eukprot:6175441-Pleurochrysis_carterae.AAC.1
MGASVGIHVGVCECGCVVALGRMGRRRIGRGRGRRTDRGLDRACSARAKTPCAIAACRCQQSAQKARHASGDSAADARAAQ